MVISVVGCCVESRKLATVIILAVIRLIDVKGEECEIAVETDLIQIIQEPFRFVKTIALVLGKNENLWD